MENKINTEKYVFSEEENEKINPHLTESEMIVLKRLSAGLSVKEIAIELNIAYDTARTHIENIKRKTGLSKNTELVAYYAADLKGKQFSLSILREFGIAAFLIFIHVCKIDL